MIHEEIADTLRLAAVETSERIRRDQHRVPKRFAPLFRCLEEHLFDSAFGAKAAWSRSGVSRRWPFPLEVPLATYIEELRVDTARRMIELAEGRLPAGRIAGAVGLGDLRSWRRVYRRHTGESPPLICRPQRLEPAFDDLGWHHAWRGTLTVDEVRLLLKRLRRLGSGPVSETRRQPPAGEPGMISLTEARDAVAKAAESSRRRLLAEVEGLPENVVTVLKYLAERLDTPGFSVTECLRQTGVSDTAISAQVRFYLGDSLVDLVEKARVEIAMRLAADQRFTVKRLAEEVDWSFRRLIRKCRKRAGTTVGKVRTTLVRSAHDPVYRLWCRAGHGAVSQADKLALEDFLRQLHPEVLVSPTGSLAVRTDVEPGRVAEVLGFYRAIPELELDALESLERMLRTHPDYSAAHWYCHWIRDRLGLGSLAGAWEEWLTANRDLAELLRQEPARRPELVREVRKFQTDAFLWLLVDCVEVRLFHDGAESEHFANLAVAAAEARWAVDKSPKSAGLRGLALALKANAVRRRNELDEASEMFKQALAAVRSVGVKPWVKARTHSLYSTLLDRQGEYGSAIRALFVASSSYKEAGDELGRLRCIIDRSSAWFSTGKDPSRLLTGCINAFDRYPVAECFLRSAHVNRMLASIYLSDGLIGRDMSRIKCFRRQMPPARSAYALAENHQIDGLIATLDRDFETAERRLKLAATWFEEHDFIADAAMCWLQYSWATLTLDGVNSKQAALTSCAYMGLPGLANQSFGNVAFTIQNQALRGELNCDLLRWGILQIVFSKNERLGKKSPSLPSTGC